MKHIECTREDGGVAVIRLARPPVNALCKAMLAEVGEAVDSLRADGRAGPNVKSLIIWGGDSVFAAGADVDEMLPPSAERAHSVVQSFRAALDVVAAFDRPTFAAVCGYALGGGLEMALACDFRVIGDNARVGFPEIQLGIIPGGGGTQRAARLIGPARVKDLVFSGRFVRASEALDMGLVDRVVPHDDVYATALEWAQRLGNGAAMAMGAAKRAIDGGLGLSLAEGLDFEERCFVEAFETQDARRGIESFLEHGPGKAVFEGN